MSRKKSYFTIILGVPDRIKKIRGSLTQAEFGKLIGKSQGTINKYENGTVLPEENTQKKIADYGGVTVKWLLHGDREAPHLTEHAQDLYEARPRELNLNYLTRALILARKFSRATRPRLSEAGEAELAAYLYEYWQETGLKPDQVVVKRYAALIKQQED